MEEKAAQSLEETKLKPCIACREMIPADAAICSYCHTSQTPPKPDRFKSIMTWVGAASACIGLFVTLLGGLRWLEAHRKEQKESAASMAVAEDQTQRGEYEAAFLTYRDILKTSPQNRKAADGQLDAVMLWVENFHVAGDGQAATQLAAAKLDEIMPVLDAASVRASGSGKADVLAHIGWAHWLNEKIAQREYGPAAEQNLRAALAVDPSNVYANAMLGNWLLQNGGNLQEVFAHFQTADNTGQARPLVRAMELGGMDDGYLSGTRLETIKIANAMRKNGEPLSDDEKRRVDISCYESAINTSEELTAALSALPPEEAWATYQWLSTHSNHGNEDSLKKDFIEASLLELSGKKNDALVRYESIREKLKTNPSFLSDRVNDAINRLSKKQE